MPSPASRRPSAKPRRPKTPERTNVRTGAEAARAGPPQRIFVTGTAGFIGYHLAELLLDEGMLVRGYDGLTDYYDVQLKRRRHQRLLQHPGFTATEAMLEDEAALQASIGDFRPDVIVHLAAQAGVRYSLEAPRTYVESNIVGTFNLLEAAKDVRPSHLLIASTSSVYGANEDMPFRETDKADSQVSIYAATKKATEVIAHSYSHLFGLPTTMLRFFTVYGPWGRPDLALFKFVDAILDDRPIDVYNHGDMVRDFTYVADLVRAIRLLIPVVPSKPASREGEIGCDSLSPAAPYRIVNIGNSDPVRLLDFIEAIERQLGKTAIRHPMPMQPGDVPATWADASLLRELTGYAPETNVTDGIAKFVEWFRDYYRK
jgi:UDP-glucuronate 4-epimerase